MLVFLLSMQVKGARTAKKFCNFCGKTGHLAEQCWQAKSLGTGGKQTNKGKGKGNFSRKVAEGRGKV